jgi:M6 family metalloprotease-like protein
MAMPCRFSFCLFMLLVVLLFATVSALAIVPPRPDSAARLPDIGEELRAAGFGRVSRPARRPSLDLEGTQGVGDESTALPLVAGTRYLPVLLGDTVDRVGTNAAATLAAELFGNWPTGSMSDYYGQVSYGQFQLEGDVHGWYQLPQTATYYEGSSGCNGLCSWPTCAGALVRDLVALADAAGVDWGRYDNDGPDGVPNSGDDDGYVDTVIIVHSGAGGECGGNNHIWSHSFYLRGWGITAYSTNTDRIGGGKIKVDDYIIQPEISCWDGLIEIGVFCHEYGHALGLPDLYDTSQVGEGIGRWGVMGAGSWGGDGISPAQPVHMCSWSKIYLGWITPTVVPCDDDYELPAVELAPSVLKVWSLGNPGSEYFLLENRQKTLNDSRLPEGGLHIWHVDETVISASWWANEVNAGDVYGVALEQADGLDQLKAGLNRGDAGDPWPGSYARTALTDLSTPGSRDNSGASTAVQITQISSSSMNMTAHVTVGVEALDRENPTATVLSPNGGEDWPVGTTRPVSWQASDNVGVGSLTLLLSHDGGLTFDHTLAAGQPASGSWNWAIPPVPAQNLVIRAVAQDAAGNEGADDSDAVFRISDQFAPAVDLYSPSGGEVWDAGSTHVVSWGAADNVGVVAVDLHLSLDGGQTWPLTVATGLSNSGSFAWEVPDVASADCRLQIEVSDGVGLSALDSSQSFTVANLSAVADRSVRFQVGPCVPNPFNPRTTIHFTNPVAGPVRIAVFDLLGRRVRVLLNGPWPAGSGQVLWDGTDGRDRAVASGIYYVQAVAGQERALLKITLLR